MKSSGYIYKFARYFFINPKEFPAGLKTTAVISDPTFFSTTRMCVSAAGIRTRNSNTVLKSIFPEVNSRIADKLVCDYELLFSLLRSDSYCSKGWKVPIYLGFSSDPITSHNCLTELYILLTSSMSLL